MLIGIKYSKVPGSFIVNSVIWVTHTQRIELPFLKGHVATVKKCNRKTSCKNISWKIKETIVQKQTWKKNEKELLLSISLRGKLDFHIFQMPMMTPHAAWRHLVFFPWESMATAGNHLVEFFLFIDNSHNSAVPHCIQLKCSHLNSLFYFTPDGPAELRCIQTECTSANTNHHSVTDLSHLLVIVLDETSSAQPDNYSNHALHKTMTRKYPHVLPAEHQTQV